MSSEAMNAVLRRLLEGCIDYAGTFPPAALSLPEAVANYASYLRGPESWVLSRFVCPLGKLEEFADLALGARAQSDGPWPLTILGEHLGNWKDEFGLVEDWAQRNFQTATVECFEVRASSSELAVSHLKSLAAAADFDVMLELPWGAAMSDDMHVIAEVSDIGVKARTGGAMPESIPTARDLAGFMKEAIDLDLRFKLTAGLHHPLRHWDGNLGAKVHGFLNVMLAGALMIEDDLSVMETQHVLESESFGELNGDDERLEFGNRGVSMDSAEEFRDLFVGFGSCSVDEPLRDLAALGLLGHGAAV